MSKRYWGGIMLFSLFLTAASGSFLFNAIKEKSTVQIPLKPVRKVPPAKPEAQPAQPEEQANPNTDPEKETQQTAPKKEEVVAKNEEAPKEQTRNILFSLYSSTKKKVYVVGDFNDWFREPMEKSGKKWSKSFKLKPGTYKYLYIVNDRRIKDPNNKKVSKDGKSLLVVKPI